jgi:hypothetical protein
VTNATEQTATNLLGFAQFERDEAQRARKHADQLQASAALAREKADDCEALALEYERLAASIEPNPAA